MGADVGFPQEAAEGLSNRRNRRSSLAEVGLRPGISRPGNMPENSCSGMVGIRENLRDHRAVACHPAAAFQQIECGGVTVEGLYRARIFAQLKQSRVIGKSRRFCSWTCPDHTESSATRHRSPVATWHPVQDASQCNGQHPSGLESRTSTQRTGR